MSPAVLSFQLVIVATCVAAAKLGPLHLLGALAGWLLVTIVFVRSPVLLFIQVPTICAVAYFLGGDIPDAMADATLFGINIWLLLLAGVAASLVLSHIVHTPMSRFKKQMPVEEPLGTGTLHDAILENERKLVEAELRATYAARGLAYNATPTQPSVAREAPDLATNYWHRDDDGER